MKSIMRFPLLKFIFNFIFNEGSLIHIYLGPTENIQVMKKYMVLRFVSTDSN